MKTKEEIQEQIKKLKEHNNKTGSEWISEFELGYIDALNWVLGGENENN